MAQLNVRLDEDTRQSFDALARARGLSTSDLIRGLIRRELNPPRRDLGDEIEDQPDQVAPPSLSAVQRHTLALQHEILAHLTAEPDEADGGYVAEHHRNMVEVLNRGYTSEYSQVFVGMDRELTAREGQLLFDIFDMFRTIEPSLDALSAEERAAGLGEHADYALRFGGFDFNDPLEARLATYATYLIKTDRWEERAKDFDAEHEHGNSHSPRLASYERMLSAWRPLWQGKLRRGPGWTRDSLAFTTAELREIITTRVHPDNR